MAIPSPTVITVGTRYIPAGVRRHIWVPTIALIAAPTTAEISAGTDLTPAVSDASGFSASANMVDVPDESSKWTSQVPGMQSADTSSLTLYDYLASVTPVGWQSLFNDGTSGAAATIGFMYIAYAGLVANGRARVFPCQVASIAPSATIADAATSVVTFAITSPPSAFQTVPSA